MITIEHLSKNYRKGPWALLDVSLTFDKGMTGLLGPNGAGKSTLMRILAALETPTSGQVMINGLPLSRSEEIREMIGYLPQFFHIYPQMTGRDYLEYVGIMKGLTNKAARRKEISQLLEMVNLQEQADRKVRTYSGGMKQRLGIAQALMGSPEILIVDEPTAGLDPQERVRFRNMLTRFSLERTVILSTHIVADIESNCRRVAVMNRGSLLTTGDLEHLRGFGRGYVWEVEMTPAQYEAADPAAVISTRTLPDRAVCRMITAARPPGGVPVEPTLEDGYIALLRRGRQ